jgi:hypothetical protein
MTTIAVFMPNQRAITGLKVYLHKTSDYSLLNPGGDVLTESSTSGWFTADVSETIDELLSVTVVNLSGLRPFGGWLVLGSSIVSDSISSLDPETLARVTKMEAIIAGTVTGAGTGTELFTGPDATIRVTVDDDGNRSNVEVL